MGADPGFDAVAGESSAAPSRLVRDLSDRSPLGLIAAEGASHVVIYVNLAFARLAGKEREEILGRPFAEVVPEGQGNGCMGLLDRVLRTGNSERLEEQEHLHAQARPVYWSYSAWATLGDDVHPPGIIIQVTEATDSALSRKRAAEINEALLISAARQHEIAELAETLGGRLQLDVKARDHFLAVLSHELRNPMAALRTGLQLLRLDVEAPGSAEASLAMMARQLEQMGRLVDDLLDVSRITKGKLALRKRRVELSSVIRDAVEAARPEIEGGGHTLTVMIPTKPVILDADPARLSQVFLNLLNNAAKYTDRGGHIRLSAAIEEGEVYVSIKDTGIGIAASHLPLVFEAFVQVDTAWERSQGGMGIGLSLVKEFIILHGGNVEARSDGEGKGSEFLVRIPIAAGNAGADEPAAQTGGVRGPGRRVLVVDDNRDAAESLARFLRVMGHEVGTAHDGAAGVTKAATFRPTVILMDLGMPNVDGYEAARRIRSAPGGMEPTLVALTGWGADKDRRRSLDAGFDHHLLKPVDPLALARLISELPIG